MRDKFIKDLESVVDETVSEKQVLAMIEKAEEIFDEYEADIKEFEDDLKLANEQKDDLKDELEELQDRVLELETEVPNAFHLEGFHNNIVTQSTIQQLFDNLDRIPIQDLQNFLNNYPQL